MIKKSRSIHSTSFSNSSNQPSQPSQKFNVSAVISICFIFLFSLILHLPNLSHPNESVFDESHFGAFVSRYVNGACFFDIHPPLAKLLLLLVAKIEGYDGSFNFKKFHVPYPSQFYVPLRFLPAFLCSLVSPLLTISLLLLGVSVPYSTFGGFLFAIDFISITQSRLILTDGILYFFITLTILFTVLYQKYQSWKMIFFQAFFAGCSFSIKFTAFSSLIVIAYSHFQILFKKSKNWFSVLFLHGVVIAFISFFVLIISMIVHLLVFTKPGTCDIDMGGNFSKLSFQNQFFTNIYYMNFYTKNLSNHHPFESRWYTWPFSTSSPIYLWTKNFKTQIHLFNNPIVAFLSFLGFFFITLLQKLFYFFRIHLQLFSVHIYISEYFLLSL